MNTTQKQELRRLLSGRFPKEQQDIIDRIFTKVGSDPPKFLTRSKKDNTLRLWGENVSQLQKQLPQRSRQSTAPLPLQAVKQHLIPFVGAGDLDSMRSSTKKFRDYADEQIQKRRLLQPRTQNKKEFDEFVDFFHALRQYRKVKDVVENYPLEDNIRRWVEKDKQTYLNAVSRAAFLQNRWKSDDPSQSELMLEVLLGMVNALGTRIPMKYRDYNSLRDIALCGIAIGNPPGGNYSNYRSIMNGLISLYNDARYERFHDAIRNMIIAVIWRYRSGYIREWDKMTQSDEKQYMQRIGLQKNQLLTTRTPRR